MAVLTSSGVTFSDSTSISSKYNVIPQSDTPLYFFQSAAPTGWTQVTTQNDKAMRVVSGTGAGTGGSNTFTGTFTGRTFSANFNVPFSTSVSNHTISTAQLPSHSHSVNAGSGAGGSTPQTPTFNVIHRNGSNTGASGGSGGHAHPSSAAASASWSAPLDMTVQYIDVIYCTFS